MIVQKLAIFLPAGSRLVTMNIVKETAKNALD